MIKASLDNIGPSGPQPDLLLFFPPNERPDRADLEEVVSTLADVAVSNADVDGHWIELVCSGLTFDCNGLAPGPSLEPPVADNWLGQRGDQSDEVGNHIALGLGPHIRAGQGTGPILQALLKLGADLAEKLGRCEYVQWVASGVRCSKSLFVELSEQFLEQGRPPISLLVRIEDQPGESVQSVGLHYFTKQELQMAHEISGDPIQNGLLLQRIAAQLLHRGKLEQVEEMVSPDGSTLQLIPSDDRERVIVRPF